MTTKLDKQGQASSKRPGYHGNKGGTLSGPGGILSEINTCNRAI